MWRRTGPRVLHPGAWPESTGKPRVLIENRNRADLWAHAEILRGAGYDVALCHGPSKPVERAPWYRRRPGFFTDSGQVRPDEERTLCPLVVAGRCVLVEGADVVVSTTELDESREVLAALSSRGSPALVVEGTRPHLERDRDVTGAATALELPVTEQRLLTAVEDALASHTDT
ncbi:MAG: hypothetical protein ACXWYO_01610 [Gaiellaceae bacterium]